MLGETEAENRGSDDVQAFCRRVCEKKLRWRPKTALDIYCEKRIIRAG